jgi:hypothetical protein
MSVVQYVGQFQGSPFVEVRLYRSRRKDYEYTTGTVRTVPFGSNHIFPPRVCRFSTYAICVAYGIADVTKLFPSQHFFFITMTEKTAF